MIAIQGHGDKPHPHWREDLQQCHNPAYGCWCCDCSGYWCGCDCHRPTIVTEADYRRFVKGLLVLGVNYHPDTPFSDYVKSNGKRSFTDFEIKRLETLRAESFKLLGDRIYTIGLEEFRKVVPK